MHKIVYCDDRSVTIDQFINLLNRSALGERRPVDDRTRIALMLEHGNLLCTAWDGGLLVGVARSVTDFAFCCYLSDLAVDEAYQHQGIGSELIRTTQRRLHRAANLVLLSAPKAREFYPKIGMTQHPSAWIAPASPQLRRVGIRNELQEIPNFFGADLGNLALAGSTTNTGTGWILKAGGVDIWGVTDEFHFAHAQHKGDFDIAVRVVNLQSAHLYTKAGIMARESLAADSRHLYLLVFADNQARNRNDGGYELQYREQAGGSSQAIYPKITPSAPEAYPVGYPNVWLRLRRRGAEFTGFASADGQKWKLYATHTLQLPEVILLGLAVTSHDPNAHATAHFQAFTELGPSSWVR